MVLATQTLIIVCTEAARDQVNTVLSDIGGGAPLNSPVALATNNTVTVGRYCSWSTDDATLTRIKGAFGRQGLRPLKGTEGRVLEAGDAPGAWGTQRFWAFNGLTQHPQQVLDSLGLTVLYQEE